jgi:hypothetical protein
LTRWESSGVDPPQSFPNAKLAEDEVEQVFRRRFAAPALQDAGAKFL